MKKVLEISLACVLLDQIIKSIIRYWMLLNTSIKVIPGFFNITYVLNDGAAWSILSGYTWVLIVIAVIALNLIYFFFIRDKDLKRLDIVTYGLLIGGILGNLIDRIMYGKVIDYLDFNLFGYDFPIFNVADICICFSVFLLIISVLRGDNNERDNC